MSALMQQKSRLAAPLLQYGRNSRLALIIVVLYLAECYLAKSFIFVGNDPTVLHYVISAALTLIMGLGFCLNSKVYEKRFKLLFAAIVAVGWSMISAYVSDYSLNYISAGTFALLLFGCFFWLPYMVSVAGGEAWRLVLYVLAVPTVLSLVILIVAPSVAMDEQSGRFTGAFISVAVACNLLCFVCILSAFAAKAARTKKEFLIYAGLCVLSISLLYLTRTRSSLLEAVVGLLLVFIVREDGALVLKRILLTGGALLVAVTGAMLAVAVSDIDLRAEQAEFRMEGGLTSSRNENWAFGLERIVRQPVFGEGLLAKQTQGGQGAINMEGKDNYNVIYDPHSLVLSLGVQGGLPFLVAVSFLFTAPLITFASRAGLSGVLTSPEFVISSLNLAMMIPAGGDMTSFGNSVDRILWILLGALSIKAIACKSPARGQRTEISGETRLSLYREGRS